MRPLIKPSLRRLRRDDSTVQVGLDPGSAVLLHGSGAGLLLDTMDGARDRPQILAAARAAGVDDDTAVRMLGLLAERGVLDDASADTGALRHIPLTERDRLRPDMASMSLASGRADAGMADLAHRRRRTVHVYGAGRVGATVAALLAASGIHHVRPIDRSAASAADASPGGLTCADAGMRRDHAAGTALRRAAPGTRTDAHDRPDLAVLAPADGTEPEPPESLLRHEVPHLVACVRELRGIVGPLVVPGVSGCLRCQRMHRTDRDPAWPRIAAQLTSGRGATEACDVVLATAVAATAAAQALAYLDGRSAPVATIGGSLELTLPDWRWRRRSWPPHPRCGCRWDLERQETRKIEETRESG